MRFCLLFLLFLTGCGTGFPVATTVSTATSTDVLTITSFDPADKGTVVNGGTVNVTFSEGQLDELTVNALTHFNLVCNGVTMTAASIIYSTGSSMAAVVLPNTGMASGTSCNFIVSPLIKDLSGNKLAGKRYATYYLQ